MNETYFDTNECAIYIKRTPPAVRKLVDRRRIPFRKPSGRLIFLKSELDKWIQGAPGVKVDDIKN